MEGKEPLTLKTVRFILVNLPYVSFLIMWAHLYSSYVERHPLWGAVVIAFLYGSAFLVVGLIYWGLLWCFYLYKGDAIAESCRTNLGVNTIIYFIVVFYCLPLILKAFDIF